MGQLFTTQSKLKKTPRKKPFENILKKKEKMLVFCIFSFSHNVFYPILLRNHNLRNSWFVVCKCFEFGHESKNLLFGKQLGNFSRVSCAFSNIQFLDLSISFMLLTSRKARNKHFHSDREEI